MAKRQAAPTMKRVDTSRGSRRFKGNALMIEKVMKCAVEAAVADVKRQRDEFRADIGRQGLEHRQAAQAKRERKAAKARALLERQP